MSTIRFELADGTINVDATVIVEGLGLEPAGVLDSVRRGALTAVCEQGIAEDVGRFRLSFFHDNRRLRFVVDRNGQILERSTARLRQRGAAHRDNLQEGAIR